MDFKDKKFFPTDIVKFVPFYTPAGMQGASLKVQLPKYSCLALVLVVYSRQVKVIMPSGRIKTFNKAGLEPLISIEQNLE